MKSCLVNIFSILLVVVSASPAVGSEAEDDAQIREARLAFNQAIRDRDIDAIGQFSAPEYHIITGRSAQSHGQDTGTLWKSYFASAQDLVCQRDTRELRINSDWGLAEELGDWNCYWSSEGDSVHASGVYAAKWQRSLAGRWLIQSEVFTTMECKGPETACIPPDPID